MRAAIYARVSSEAQRDRHTIENQLRILPDYIRSQGWTIAGTFIDDGRSAKTGMLEARAGFADLVRAAERREIDVVVVVDIDRLTRTDSMEERARILGPFQRLGIRIVTPSGGELDLRTFLGELYVTMQALVAAEENRKRTERIKAGKLRAIAEGRKPAGPTPYGLTYSRAAGSWSIDTTAAAIVREIYARVIAGESCMVIADDLDARGVEPPRGRWTRHTVWQIVRARTATGTWTADKRKRLTVAVPAILDEPTWQAAQQALLAHGKRGLRKTKHVYLLEGLAVCAACGSPIAIRSATRNPKRTNGNPSPAAYVCRARKLARHGERRCASEVVPVAEADARVWTAVASELADPGLARELARRAAARASDRRDWSADAEGYRARLGRLAKTEAAVLARFRRGAVSEAALDTELAALNRERADVTAQLQTAERAAARSEREAPGDPAAWVVSLRELAAFGTPEARQRVVRVLVSRGGAVFEGTRIKLTLRVGESASRSADGDGDAGAVSVVGASTRTHHEDSLRIRVVA